jgi:class I fructose-bisphosphate aldolase
MLYGHGPRNGTLAVLPLDQGLEHGPADFFPNPAAVDTDFQFRLAVEGDYSAIALGVGLADKYMKEYAGRIPLILKLNGKTNIADDGDAVSSLSASVEDAVRLGADAVGFTLYVGSPREDAGIRDFQKVRQDCERLGMPVVMWAYPRGRAINARGGKGTLYAQDYAARVAEEMGADLVKLHEPEEDNERCPEPYRSLKEAAPERLRRVVRSAGRVMVLFSGGVKQDNDAAVLRKVSSYMDAGATGRDVRAQYVAAPVRPGRRADAPGASDPGPPSSIGHVERGGAAQQRRVARGVSGGAANSHRGVE